MTDLSNQLRSPGQRKDDLLGRLARETDVWVATADGDAVPCLVPLWFRWDGEALWLSTRTTSPTGRNLRRSGRARLALRDTGDVVLIDGTAEAFGTREVPDAAADAFALRTGWDPRRDSASYGYFRIAPTEVQAWRGEHELRGRYLMRNGVWSC